MVENVQCPVCTLFLHAGMSLTDHLETHPKEQVIKALVQLTITGGGNATADGVLKAALLGDTLKNESNSQQLTTEQNRLASSSTSLSSSTVELNKTEIDVSRSNSRMSNISSASATSCSTATNSSLNFTNSIITSEKATPLDLVPQHDSACSTEDLLMTHKSNSKQQSTAYQCRSNIAVENQVSTMSEAFNAMQFSRFQQQQQQQHQQQHMLDQNQQMHIHQLQQQQLQSSNQSQFKMLQQQQQLNKQQQNVATLSKHSNFGNSLLQQHQLPPPPPPMPVKQQQQQSKHHSSPLDIPASVYASNHQQPGSAYTSENQRHHHNQQQSQSPKIVFTNGANGLPPPPPLQLFSYQHSGHQHQKPPPAYGTAISQIRSQQNKQNIPISNVNFSHHHQQQQQQQQQPLGLLRPMPTNVQRSISNTNTTSPLCTVAVTNTGPALPPSPIHSLPGSKSSDLALSNNNNQIENENDSQQKLQLPPPPPPPLMQVPVAVAAQQKTSSNASAIYAPAASAVNYHHHHRQTNSPSLSTLVAAAVQSPPSSSSVLRFAESPVAHYLERDNGDFIVQETPKHIVECVEEDDGEFSVFERFHQSPPSVLHIHDDDDDDDENENENGDEDEAKDLENENSTQSVDNSNKKLTSTKTRKKEDKPGFAKEKSSSSNDGTDIIQTGSSSNSSSNATIDNTNLKKSTKNTITVLSDVQLNLNEYLDLMGNIIASGKIAKRRTTCSASAPIPLVKIEKVEPDDEDFDFSLTTNESTEKHDTKAASSQAYRHETDKRPQQQEQSQAVALDDAPGCSKIFNKSNNCKTNSKQESMQSVTSKNAKNLALPTPPIHLTSVIRMATTVTTARASSSMATTKSADKNADLEGSQIEKEIKAKTKDETTHQPQPRNQQHYQQSSDDKELTLAASAVDSNKKLFNINEATLAPQDLSQPKEDVESSQATTRHDASNTDFSCGLPPPPPLRKGPKKLVIKPKSTKTEPNAKKTENVGPRENATSDNAGDTTTQTPTCSNTLATVTPPMSDVVIKCEPGSYEISSNNAGTFDAALAYPDKFFKQQLQGKNAQLPPSTSTLEAAVDYSAIKNEKDCSESLKSFESLSSPDLSANASKDSSTAADARVLLDFANSTKRSTATTMSTTAAANYLTAAAVNSNIFFSSTSYFTNAAQMATKNDDDDDDDYDVKSHQKHQHDIESMPEKSHKCKELPDQEFIAVENQISVSSSPTISTANEANANHENQAQHRQQHSEEQKEQQNTQSQANPSDYPFSFFYGSSHAESTSKSSIHHHPNNHQQLSFSPSIYQQTPDATTTAATVASSSTLDTLEDSSSTPNESNHAMQMRFGSVLNHNSATVPQWYQSATLVAHSDFSAALSLDNAAVDGDGDVADGGKYLDLDACKREATLSSSGGCGGGLQNAPSSTSSSFAAANESSLAGGCTTADTLNIRTDEKMPPKGEISEQESNCDIDNSWSQPVYGEIPSKFYRTTFPGIFTHDAAWNQDEFFTVQDLSPSAANGASLAAAACKNKSFEFHLPMESATTSFASAVVTLSNDEILPSTSAAGAKKQKRKRVSDGALHRPVVKRPKPTSTITSSQQLMQNIGETDAQNIFQQPETQTQRIQKPTTSTAAAAAASASTSTTSNGAEGASVNMPARMRRKVYVCPHCSMQFNKLRDKNHHMIEIHSYIRQNRRLISAAANIGASVADASAPTHNSSSAAIDAAFSSVYTSATNAPATSSTAATDTINDGDDEFIADDSKHHIKIKMEYDQPAMATTTSPMSTQQPLSALVAGIDGIDPKTEYIDEKSGVLEMSEDDVFGDAAAAANALATDTKPTLLPQQQQPLALATAPTTKLGTLYRMLISYNLSILKQSQNLSESDEKLIESSIFFCYTCRTNFSSVKLYDAHLTEHPAECFTCGKRFQRWKNFSLHLKRHLGWKEFGCNICDKKFVVRSALVEHTRMHTGHTPLKCNICGKSFKRYSNLTQHRKRHVRVVVRKKEYVCHCGEVLPSKARFLWHKETHDSKPKCCPYCCDRFVHANSLRRHIRLAHSDKFDYAEPMECPMCKQVFAKSSIKAHMATHSNTQHDCNICNKSFSTKWNLKIHLWVHANRTAKPFKCEHCPKAFVREVDFKNHMNAHKQIKPYTCEYCGCKFIRKYNYMRHRREHHGNKKFTCETCKKSFHRHYYLIEHKRIHTGERPFQCTICGKSSTTKTNHNKHLRIHHSRDPFTVET